MHTKKIPILFLLLFFIQPCLMAAEEGGYAGAFLRMGVGAKALGMGGAFVSVADDASAIHYNPAALSFIRERVFTTAYRALSLDRKFKYLGYVQPLRHEAGVGIGWISAGLDDIDGRDEDGQPTEKLSDSENAITFCFSKRTIPHLAFGLAIRYFQQKLAGVSAYTVGLGFGGIYRKEKKFSVGASVQNLRSRYSWDTKDLWARGTTTTDTLPVNYRVGLSYWLLRGRLLTAFDLEKNLKQSMRYHIGADFTIYRDFNLRLGYNNDRFTFGGGLSRKYKNFKFSFNYAYLPEKVATQPAKIYSLEVKF